MLFVRWFQNFDSVDMRLPLPASSGWEILKLRDTKRAFTLWWTNIAIENTTFIVDFPIKNGGFP